MSRLHPLDTLGTFKHHCKFWSTISRRNLVRKAFHMLIGIGATRTARQGPPHEFPSQFSRRLWSKRRVPLTGTDIKTSHRPSLALQCDPNAIWSARLRLEKILSERVPPMGGSRRRNEVIDVTYQCWLRTS